MAGWLPVLPLGCVLASALLLLAACDDLGGSFGSVSRTVTNKGTEFDVTFSVGMVAEQIPVGGGRTITEKFDATFIDIRRANGVAMKAGERKRALEIGSSFCDVNRLPKAPVPGRADFDGIAWRLTNHCGKIFG